MKMIKVKDYFEVKYGTNDELVNLEKDPKGINFVSRTSINNGVSAKVKPIKNKIPNSANTISVSCGGSVMESFLQKEEYYSGRDIYILKPLIKLTDKQLLFYCVCLRANKYRYNYGRQANKSLKEIKIPSIETIPKYVNNISISFTPNKNSIIDKTIILEIKKWKYFSFNELFKIEKGRETFMGNKNGEFVFISATRENNGVTDFVSNGNKIFEENTITVPSNGASTGEAFYQDKKYFATGDVNILIPLFKLNKYIALFLTTIIRLEKYRFSYGRKWGKDRMLDSKIKLPNNERGEPDWGFMENYIKSLPYSKGLKQNGIS